MAIPHSLNHHAGRLCAGLFAEGGQTDAYAAFGRASLGNHRFALMLAEARPLAVRKPLSLHCQSPLCETCKVFPVSLSNRQAPAQTRLEAKARASRLAVAGFGYPAHYLRQESQAVAEPRRCGACAQIWTLLAAWWQDGG